MAIKEIAFVSYAITDVEKATAFYGKVLGLKESSRFEQGDMVFIEYLVGDQAFSIGKGSNQVPGPQGGCVAFEVDDFDQTMASLKEHGADIKMDGIDTGACKMAVVADPDGNLIMIHKRAKN